MRPLMTSDMTSNPSSYHLDHPATTANPRSGIITGQDGRDDWFTIECEVTLILTTRLHPHPGEKL